MKSLNQRIENLSPTKRALLEIRLREKARGPKTHIPPRPRREAAALSFNQESLWFLERLNPNTSLYNLSDAMRFKGQFNLTALQQTLDAIVARHESLRTTFAEVDGEPRQIIHERQRVQLKQFDVSEYAEAEREAIRLLSQEAERPLDLVCGPLARFVLIKRSADEHILLVLMHHIISDGWSVGVFWQEFVGLYRSFLQGEASSLPALRIQFGDYTDWMRKQQEQAMNGQLAYWKKQLEHAPALLELPTDRPRPAVQSFRGAQALVIFPHQLRDNLKALSQREGATLFMTLLAAFNVLLARYSGQQDLVIGSPVAGRTLVETEPLIGFLVNLLALRTDLRGNPTFRALLQQVRHTALEAFSHQDVPFEQVVTELRPERNLSYNPIFQTAFALQNETTAELRLPGLQLSPVKISSVTAKFDLFLSLCEVPTGLRAVVEYNTDLFDAATIQRLLRHYQTLLESVVADSTQRISDLSLLSPSEQQEILLTWNDSATDYPKDASLHELFERQAAHTPNHVAVVAGAIQLSYRELNSRANRVAHYLRSKGVGPDSLVGVFTDRSLLTVIALLGILKAGGAYLPLDADYPKARLQFMLQDAQVSVLLTQQKMQAKLPETSASLLCLDSDWDTIAKYPEDNPTHVTTAENLAYVIYTSGSTGQPKGVSIPHRAVNRLVCNTNYVQLDETDCIAQVSNMSFDAATFELWGALLHGAKLVLLNKDIALSPQAFVAQLREHNVTTLFLTTALFNLLAREVPNAFSTLKTLMFGGEACDPLAVRAVLKNGPPRRLLHVYGPTESTTFASWHLIEDVPENATTIPIGRPISNTTMYLLDQYLNPVPVGIPGEIFIGGDGLARGYWQRPALTEEKFISIADCGLRIADWRREGEKEGKGDGATGRRGDTGPTTDNRQRTTDNNVHPQLYRTGDLARYLPDGSIEFLGRKDEQIKLRGFRIELGEIMTALLAHPAVQDCVVIVTAGKNHDKKLVAYYVTAQEAAPAPSELRDFLRQRLPDYMLPAMFLRMDELPLNPNGKVDRHKLPRPEESRPEAKRDVTLAQDELEVRLTWIWEKVLGVKSIGIDDNFFDLGGHSLLAVRLFTEIEALCGRRLPLAVLFQSPTIAQLATVLRQQGWRASWRSVVALRPSGTNPPFFCVHAVGGNVLEYRGLARHLPSAQPFYGLQSLGLDGQTAPLTNIPEMAAHYIKEMRQIQPQGPYYLGGRSFGGSVALEMAQQLYRQGEEVALLAMFDTYPLGWTQLVPSAEARQLEKAFLRQRLQRHWQNLRQLRWPDKFDYVFGKAQYKKRKYKNLWWRVRNQLGASETTTLNDTLRTIEEINYLATKKYKPQIYPGKVTFFCAEEEVRKDENIAGWQRLAGGGVEIVPIPGDHQTMIKEPHVQELAKKLMECLNRATNDNQ